MKYRDLHPGDVILIWGDAKVIERVDKTHIATRGPNDHLELWAYGEDHLDFIKFENRLHLRDLGFIEDGDALVFDTYDGYVIRWTKEVCYIENDRIKKLAKHDCCTTLNTVQQFFYEVAGIELKLDI